MKKIVIPIVIVVVLIGILGFAGFWSIEVETYDKEEREEKAGGKLMLNKKTWFAHKHRSFSRTHQEGSPENPANREKSWSYCLKVWRDYYKKEICPKWKI